ncbi:predicted protein, partial [Arabidopsis lyrata subsp. lyrata]
FKVLNDEGDTGAGCGCNRGLLEQCPVPPGYDARQVGPCIKRCVENLGYSGPLTIFAVGLLTNIPDDVL